MSGQTSDIFPVQLGTIMVIMSLSYEPSIHMTDSTDTTSHATCSKKDSFLETARWCKASPLTPIHLRELHVDVWYATWMSFRCYEVQIKQSKKAGSHQESNLGQLWVESPVLCYWAMTGRQPPTLTILYMYCSWWKFRPRCSLLQRKDTSRPTWTRKLRSLAGSSERGRGGRNHSCKSTHKNIKLELCFLSYPSVKEVASMACSLVSMP